LAAQRRSILSDAVLEMSFECDDDAAYEILLEAVAAPCMGDLRGDVDVDEALVGENGTGRLNSWFKEAATDPALKAAGQGPIASLPGSSVITAMPLPPEVHLEWKRAHAAALAPHTLQAVHASVHGPVRGGGHGLGRTPCQDAVMAGMRAALTIDIGAVNAAATELEKLHMTAAAYGDALWLEG
jgi:hypothetical protein